MSPRNVIATILALSLLATAVGAASDIWQKLFDGKSLNGWRLMAVHGGNGGVWTVEQGALVANQEKDHKGGLIGTEKKYSDYEIELEFKPDYPVDSGLFLRVRDDGMGYQITIDYLKGGFIGSLYAPAEGGFIQQNKDWEKYFKKNAWNKLRARIEGQPAHVTAWLNDVKMTDFKDNRERYPREGYIGLQVHGGEGSWGPTSKARFRNIRILELQNK
ncbi:MAG TPA: DUF1080 domain-containing protein [Blastocatellia bacterium]|nr:DUF1080 domain-containing protein [Blastocatellia bacterium]